MINYFRLTQSLNRPFIQIIALTVIIYLLVWSLPNPQYAARGPRSSTPIHNRVDAVHNETLGFERVFVVNLPSRPDKRDYITLASSVVGFRPEPIDGVNPDNIDVKAHPVNWDPNYLPSEFGTWRAHMNVIQRIVRDRVATAFILEDDADWDINLKKQFQGFASASQSLQSLQIGNIAAQSPYGNDWDLLWIGHCGIRCRPGPVHVSTGDATVVPLPQLPSYWRDPPLGAANNTRLVCRAEEGVCALGYAVTYLGAQKILSSLSLTPEGVGAQYDVAISRYCQNGWLKCIAPFPSMIGMWRPAGPKSRGSDIHSEDGWVEEATPIGSVYSTMYNVRRLLTGKLTVYAVTDDDAVAREIDPAQLELPEGRLQVINATGLYDITF
ncbi:hypothetical protein BDV23DRAFT_161323 [Aspergillus alliaceus]|uniref:LPS glycosyltransferase n=1 Tax=Petromyces alliaceus TaxID=209559 RepID=A0A5N7C0U5_PETAA|nr:hypothetical protein BDV23DRAFT_161323 [Aspergillus alliaceus]